MATYKRLDVGTTTTCTRRYAAIPGTISLYRHTATAR